jgi:multicomponent K+:H+ antiporter subunit G
MNAGDDSMISEILTSVLLVAGAATTLIGTVGLLRFRTFYERVHAPTLGTTLGVICVALASAIYFTASGGRAAVHEVLIALFVTTTTPVTLLVLVRAAVFRDEFESSANHNQGTEL